MSETTSVRDERQPGPGAGKREGETTNKTTEIKDYRGRGKQYEDEKVVEKDEE